MATSDMKKSRPIMIPNKPIYDRVKDHLSQNGEASGGTLFIKCCYPYGESTVYLSKAMEEMEQAGQVVSRKDGSNILYSLKK